MKPKEDPPWDTTIADLRKEIERLRERVAELEAELKFSEKQVQNSLVLISEKDKKIKQRGERMKAMVHRILFAKDPMTSAEADEYLSWFDSENGEPK